jgi:hypothetical protein
MQTVTTIGLDIAKSVFQVHGVDSAGQVVIRRQLKRRYVLAFFQKLPPCLVGIEAWARMQNQGLDTGGGSLALQVKETSTRILSPETEVWVRFPPDRCMLLTE